MMEEEGRKEGRKPDLESVAFDDFDAAEVGRLRAELARVLEVKEVKKSEGSKGSEGSKRK